MELWEGGGGGAQEFGLIARKSPGRGEKFREHLRSPDQPRHYM